MYKHVHIPICKLAGLTVGSKRDEPEARTTGASGTDKVLGFLVRDFI